jgi:hypothetical protein
VAAAVPNFPSVLPVAGEARTSVVGGIVAGLGLAGLGAALQLRNRRRAAQGAASGATGDLEPELSDVSPLPLDEDIPG